MDESGDPAAWNDSNFVLAGVAVHEGQVFRLGKRLDDIQTAFFPLWSPSLGFHATEIRAGRVRPFSQVSSSLREKLMFEIYDSIATAGFPQLIAFATVMHVSSAQSTHQVLHDTF